MVGRRSALLRLFKPIVAGMALAYLLTAFVDRPSPVHFQPENPYASKQAEIVEPQTELVLEQNIMKLGSPLSVRPDSGVPDDNPLLGLGDAPIEAPTTEELFKDGQPPSVRGDVVEQPLESFDTE